MKIEIENVRNAAIKVLEAQKEALQARLAAAEELLRAVEWDGQGPGDEYYCPKCDAWKDHGHAPDCKLAAFLSESKAKK